MKRVITVALVIAVLACVPAAWAQVRTVGLQTLGGSKSYVFAVNDLGESVGWSETASGTSFPALWDSSGNVIGLLTTLSIPLNGVTQGAATGINNNHQVVGNYTQSGLSRAFIFTAINGMFEDLGTLGGTESQAIAINEIGQVIGRSKDSNNQWKLFIITPLDTNGDGVPDMWYPEEGAGVNTLMTDLGNLGGNDTGDINEANAINNKGVVVGRSSSLSPGTASYYHAFGWSSETGMVNLGTLGGDNSEALAVSDYGHVVGYSSTTEGATRAFAVRPQPCNGVLSLFCDEMPQPGVDFTMVGLDPLAGNYSIARSVNNSGQVAGTSSTADGSLHACIWNGVTPLDLGTLGGAGQDTWSEASAMNETGQVIGWSGPPNCPSSDKSCYHGFFWSEWAGMIELPPLDGNTRSWAVAISNTGFIAGITENFSDPQRPTHAVVWIVDSTPPASLDSLIAAVNYFAQNGEINDKNLWKSLLRKLNEAQEAVQRENMNVAVNKLRDFIDQLNAQSGKHITTNAASLLIKDAGYVISHM